MDREQAELFGDWSPPQAVGIVEFAVTASSELDGTRVNKRVRCRRQFKMTMAPCPEALAEMMGSGFGSMVHLNPVELGRTVDGWREPASPRARRKAKSSLGIRPGEGDRTPNAPGTPDDPALPLEGTP